MASVMPFDNAVIDGTAVPASTFIAGSGEYREEGVDVAVTTADGRIHRERQAVLRRARFRVRGNLAASLESGVGPTVPVSLKLGANAIAAFSGLVTARYLAGKRETRVEIRGDAEG